MTNNKFGVVSLKGVRVDLDNYKYVLILRNNEVKQPVRFSNDISELEKSLQNLINTSVFKYEQISNNVWYCEDLDMSYEIIEVDDLYR